MAKGLFKQGLNAFLLVAIAAFLLVVLYSAIGQQIFPRISEHRVSIERYLSDTLNADIQIGKLWGEMDVLTPALHLEELTLYTEAQDSPQLFIAAVDAVLDPHQSLINLTPVFKKVRLTGVSIDLRHLGQDQATDESPDVPEEDDKNQADEETGAGLENLIVSLLLQQSVEINGVSIITHVNGKDRTLNLEQLALKGDGFHRLINGHIAYGEKAKQIKTGFRIYSEGNPYDLDNFYARGSVDLPRLDFAFWLREFLGNQDIEQLDASAQLNFEFDKGLLQGARLALATTNLKLANQPRLKHVNSTLWLTQNTGNDWSLWLENGSFTLLDKKWSLENLGLKLARQPDGNRWQIFARELDLKETHRLLGALEVLPAALSDRFAELNPEGLLQNATFVLTTKERADTEFTFASQIQNLNVEPADGIPGISNVSGVIAANKDVGRVQFNSPDMKLALPTLYDEPLAIKQGSGQVEWFIEPKQIRIVGDGLDLQLEEVEHVRGGFQVWLAQEDKEQSAKVNDRRESQLMLNLAVEDAKASAHKILVPKVLDEGVRDWLDEGIAAGTVNNGQLMLFTSIDENAPDPILELHLDIEDAQLSYLSEWPAVKSLDGQLYIDAESVRVAAPKGDSMGGKVHNGVVVFRQDQNDQPALWVSLEAMGSAQQGLDYFKKTPLREVVNGAMDEWLLSGVQKFAMSLKVPMSSDSDEGISIDLTSQLAKNDLRFDDINLEFQNIKGLLGYSNQKGLYSQGLETELWDEEVKLDIATEYPNGEMVSRFDIQGQLNADGLKAWTKLGLLESLNGRSKINGQFVLDTREGEKTGLSITSDLVGMSLDLPQPYGLAAQDPRHLEFDLNLDDPLIIKLAYGKEMNLAMSLKDGSLYSGQVYLGQTEAYLPDEKGLVITGHLGDVNAEEWLPVWERIEKANQQFDKQKSQVQTQDQAKTQSESDKSEDPSADESDSPLRQILISADAISYESQRFESIKLDARHNAGDWRFDLDSPVAKGTVLFPKSHMLSADFAYVHLPEPEVTEESSETTESEDPLKNVDPKAFPAMKLKAGEIFVGATNYGRWDVEVQPDEAGARFVINDGTIKKLDVKGDVYWYKKENDHTQAKLNLSTRDVGGIQREWRMKPAIEAEKGRANVVIDWLGSPAAFNVASLSGDVNFKLQDGSFVEAKDAEALNAFGLLNFASIGRRLRLDFRDLYTDGLAFDRFEAKTQLDNGVLTIIDTMEVEGPAAKFATSGSINLNTKELNQELSVTFPVSSTLPLVAILAGFAPPVAASIFVGERLVGDEIERFTSATYEVKGPWDDPDLKLKKRFDNEIEGKKSRTFWHRMKDVFGIGKD